jgi:hypothetical protein
MYLRNELFQLFLEPDRKIATQIALIFAKVSRYEAREWPELFPALQTHLGSDNAFQQSRSALVLRHVVSELSSKVLFSNRIEFQSVCVTAVNNRSYSTVVCVAAMVVPTACGMLGVLFVACATIVANHCQCLDLQGAKHSRRVPCSDAWPNKWYGT